MMSRHTTFRYCLDPTVEQSVALARHAGAARFAFNQSLALVKTALTHRKICPEHPVPWTRFDLINAFNAWKKTEAAGRIFVVGTAGVAKVQVTGLSWRTHGRAKILYATVSCRARRWWISRTTEASDLHPAHHHQPRECGDSQSWVGIDRGLTVFAVAATADGAEIARVDTAPEQLATGLSRQRHLAKSLSRKQKGSNSCRRAAARRREGADRHRRGVGETVPVDAETEVRATLVA